MNMVENKEAHASSSKTVTSVTTVKNTVDTEQSENSEEDEDFEPSSPEYELQSATCIDDSSICSLRSEPGSPGSNICSVSGCGKTFIRPSRLIHHMRLHEGQVTLFQNLLLIRSECNIFCGRG